MTGVADAGRRGTLAAGQLTRALVLVLAVIAGYVAVLTRDQYLPERFLADGFLIRRIAQGLAAADQSYTNTANVYAFFGLQNHPEIAYVAGYTLAVIAFAVVWAQCRELPGGGWGVTILIGMGLMLSAIYLGYYSKDVFVLLCVLGVLLLRRSWWGGALLLALLLGYGLVFRSYWVVVAVCFAGYWLIQPRLGRVGLFLTGAAVVGFGTLMITVLLGVPGDEFRSRVNESRVGLDVGTIITRFVELQEPLGGVVNNVLTYAALIVPIPVLLIGGLYYLVIALMFLALWVQFFRWVSPASDAPHGDGVLRRAVALIMAFVTVQALFEPDYGSALRHLTPLLPLFVYVVWQSQGRREMAALESDDVIAADDASPRQRRARQRRASAAVRRARGAAVSRASLR